MLTGLLTSYCLSNNIFGINNPRILNLLWSELYSGSKLQKYTVSGNANENYTGVYIHTYESDLDEKLQLTCAQQKKNNSERSLSFQSQQVGLVTWAILRVCCICTLSSTVVIVKVTKAILLTKLFQSHSCSLYYGAVVFGILWWRGSDVWDLEGGREGRGRKLRGFGVRGWDTHIDTLNRIQSAHSALSALNGTIVSCAQWGGGLHAQTPTHTHRHPLTHTNTQSRTCEHLSETCESTCSCLLPVSISLAEITPLLFLRVPGSSSTFGVLFTRIEFSLIWNYNQLHHDDDFS